MVKKRVIVDGVVVGEIEATGDIERDVIATRAFLEKKGLPTEITRNDAMFHQANAFAQLARNIFRASFAHSPYKVSNAAPFIVNATFSLEIYLKTIHQAYGRKIHGHDLAKLFSDLPQEAKTIAFEAAAAIRPQHKPVEGTDLIACLESVGNAFEKWRYLYENDNLLVEMQPLLYATHAAYEACCRVRKLKAKK